MSTRTDLVDELEHCRRMATQTQQLLNAYTQDVDLYGELTGGEATNQGNVERQHRLWVQLATELEAHLHATNPVDQMEALFS